MANPNLVNMSTMLGKTAVAQLTTSTTSLITNSASSGVLVKINSLLVTNVDGTNAADVSAWILRSSTQYRIASTISVPADSTLVLLSKDTSIYLEEDDILQITASASGDLTAVCSYETIS